MRVLAVAVFVLGWSSVTQEPTPAPAVLQKAQQLAQPTAEHTRLQRLVGTWDVSVHTTWPGQPEQRDSGRVVAAAILGGRYIVANYALQQRGVKVEAVQILGFDVLRGVYTASWRDDLSTWSVETSGPPVAATPDLLTLTGTLADARDPTGRPFRQVVEFGDGQRITMRLFDTVDGREVAVQSLQWTKP